MSETRFRVGERLGVLGRAHKQSIDISRVVIDFKRWLDPGEDLGSVSRFSLNTAQGGSSWQQDYPFCPGGQELPPDDPPLYLANAEIEGTKANILLGAGTPTRAYVVSFMATGSNSGRERECDFHVKVDQLVNDAMITSLDPIPSTDVIYVNGSTTLPANTIGSVFVNNTTDAAITITLPSPPYLGETLTIKDIAGNSLTYPITIVGASGATIDTHASIRLQSNFSAATLRWNGSAWSQLA